MQRRAKLFEAPEHILFSLKDIAYSPESPRKEEPFTVTGKIELFGIPFPAPVWIVATVTYPIRWWEEITPIIGAAKVVEFGMVMGGDFELIFKEGFLREGEFELAVKLYPGPSFPIDAIVFSPTPAFATEERTFIVGGEVPPEEIGFRSFRILSYAKNGGPPVTPPGVLELDIGDRCRVNVGFDHMNGAVTGEFHAAIWQERPWDPHDEVLNADKSFTVPSSPDWEPWEGYIDIIITSAISPGTEYGLYVKIMGITGGDIFTEYLENVITIKGIPAMGECSDLGITSYDSVSPPSVLEVDPGDTIRVTSEFDYIGPATTGKLYSALWHPSWYDPHDEIAHGEKSITLPASPEGNHITGYIDIKVPSGFAGTDFGLYTKVTGALKDAMSPYYENIITIVKEIELETLEVRIDPVGGGYVTVSPAPAGGTQHNWLFLHGTTVYVTAHPSSGYVFESWSGEMTDTPAITAPVYPMTEHRLITAHFREEVVIPPSDLYLPTPGFEATPGTYDLGDRVPWTMVYQYKGKAQGGWLTISLGTGVYPSFFTKYTFPRVAVSFDEAMDWASGYLSGTFTLPTTLVLGQTYSVRAKLETADGKRETDTDWGVITIAEVAPPEQYTLTISVSPWGAGTVTGAGTYAANVRATCYASPATGYEFDRWGGDATGTLQSISVLMDRDKYLIAYFREKVVPGYTLLVWVSPMAAGWVTKEPDKPRYTYGEIVKLTAHEAPGYSFQSWWVGDEFLSSGTTINFMVLGDHEITAYYL